MYEPDDSGVIIQDGEYLIEINQNIEPYTRANVFLTRSDSYNNNMCVGGADCFGGKGWKSDITKIPDDDGSDVLILVQNASREQAIKLLWDNRHNAY